jgi:hypothetical protein
MVQGCFCCYCCCCRCCCHSPFFFFLYSSSSDFVDLVWSSSELALLILMFVVQYTLVMYMFYSGQTRCTLYSLFLSSLALRVSGAICTHHQEHNCRVQPQVVYLWKNRGFGIKWCGYSFCMDLCVLVFQSLAWYFYAGMCVIGSVLVANSTRNM